MTTTASHCADLRRAISRPNGWGVRCTCDVGALMMVIKNSCVPASNHSFMEELEKYPTSFSSAPRTRIQGGWRGNVGKCSHGQWFYITKLSPDSAHTAFWKKIKSRDVSRGKSAPPVDQGPAGSFQLSGEAAWWVKPRVTSEHEASWEIQFRLEEMLVGQMSNSMQFCDSGTFSSDAVKWILGLVSHPSPVLLSLLFWFPSKVAAMWNISSVARRSLAHIQSYLHVWFILITFQI